MGLKESHQTCIRVFSFRNNCSPFSSPKVAENTEDFVNHDCISRVRITESRVEQLWNSQTSTRNRKRRSDDDQCEVKSYTENESKIEWKLRWVRRQLIFGLEAKTILVTRHHHHSLFSKSWKMRACSTTLSILPHKYTRLLVIKYCLQRYCRGERHMSCCFSTTQVINSRRNMDALFEETLNVTQTETVGLKLSYSTRVFSLSWRGEILCFPLPLSFMIIKLGRRN
jgi:hypothetical protein